MFGFRVELIAFVGVRGLCFGLVLLVFLLFVYVVYLVFVRLLGFRLLDLLVWVCVTGGFSGLDFSVCTCADLCCCFGP